MKKKYPRYFIPTGEFYSGILHIKINNIYAYAKFIMKSGKKQYALYICGTKEFCLDLSRMLLEKLNVRSKIYKNNNNCSEAANSYQIVITNCKNVKIVLDWCYSKSNFHMERKFKLYERICEKIKELNMRDEKHNQIINDSKNGIKINQIAKNAGYSRWSVYLIRRKRKAEWKQLNLS